MTIGIHGCAVGDTVKQQRHNLPGSGIRRPAERQWLTCFCGIENIVSRNGVNHQRRRMGINR